MDERDLKQETDTEQIEAVYDVQDAAAQEKTGEQPAETDYSDMTEDELKDSVKEEIKAERKANIIEWIKDIAVAAILAAIILTFIKPIVIQQESMLETFLPGDYVIVSRQAYHLFGEPQRGDVIVFKSELEDERGKAKFLIKRIIGLPGDRVEVRDDGYVYINGELLDEPYLRAQGISDELAGPVDVDVDEGQLFVCGDNREVSLDSRTIGCIEQDTILGKVKWLIFNTKGLRKGQ